MHDAYILTFFTWLLRCFVNDIVINLTRNHRLRNHDDRMITSGQKGNVRIAKKNLHVKNEPTYKRSVQNYYYRDATVSKLHLIITIFFSKFEITRTML